MNVELDEDAVEFGNVVREAIASAGGDELVQRAEVDPSGRAALVEPVLKELGVFDLDPRGSSAELEAAAAACRSAGYWALPYPVAERLARTLDGTEDAVAVVDPAHPRAAAAGLDLTWSAVTLEGWRSIAEPKAPLSDPRTSGFVCDLVLHSAGEHASDAPRRDVALALALPCWTLLGMMDRAMEVARSHVLVREQFGQPLAGFQDVQFKFTDAEVERAGTEILAKYALWSIATDDAGARDDALALRLAAIEAAEVVFRITHQVQGATGFCDESVQSWLSRYSQPLRRLPYGVSATREQLATSLGRVGLTGIFDASSAGVPGPGHSKEEAAQ
jgi:hypothetical protein